MNADNYRIILNEKLLRRAQALRKEQRFTFQPEDQHCGHYRKCAGETWTESAPEPSAALQSVPHLTCELEHFCQEQWESDAKQNVE